MKASTSFVPARVSHTRIQTYAAPPAVLFPLHGAVEEAKWAVGWEPEMLHAGPERAIFLTRHGGAEAVWVNTLWDPASGRVSYVHVSQDRDVTEIHIAISGREDGPSRVEITYTFTGLSPAGNEFVLAQTAEAFDRMMTDWEEEMACFLATGRKLER